MNDRHVVLVGGGHAHIQVLEQLARVPLAGARLTLLVDEPVAVYSGMVPGVVAGQYAESEVELDPVALARQVGAEVVLGRAVRVAPATRTITTADGAAVRYDIASFDIGSTVAGLDLPGVQAHALPTRPIGLFVRRVGEILAAARGHPAGTPFRVVVVGGGAGGVEVAFTLQHRLSQEAGLAVRVLLLDGGSRILGGYADSLRGRVSRRARARGIEIRCAARVRGALPDALQLENGSSVACDLLVWVTGAVSQPIFQDSGLATDARGFVRTRATLQVEGHDDLFAVGDCGTLIDYPATPKAGVYAVRQGPVLTRNLRAVVAGEQLDVYRPQSDFLTLLNLGDGTAVGAKWGVAFEGRWVMRLKDLIDRRFMRRFPAPTPPDA